MERTTHTKRKNRLAFRTGVLYFSIPAISITLLLVIGVYITNTISDDFSRRLARQYSIEASANFLTATNSHFVLAQQLAHSTTISRFMAHGYDDEIRARAIEEIMGYAAYAPHIALMFSSYLTSDVYDLRAGFTEEDFVTWWQVDTQNAAWFVNTKYAELPFNLNIQRSRPVDGVWSPYVWTNHRMYYQGQFVGVATAGSSLQFVFDAVFADYDISNRRGYIIDYNGLVRVDSAELLKVLDDGISHPVIVPETENNLYLAERINEHLEMMVNGAFQIGGMICDAIPLTGDFRYASLAPIIGTNWSVLVLSSHTGIFDVVYLPMIISVFIVLSLSVLIGNLLIRNMALVPLYKLTQSTANLTESTTLFGLDRDDEIGDLSRTIHNLKEELLYREKLLTAGNQIAKTLLTADNIDSLMNGIDSIGKLIDVDRIAIWQLEDRSGELYFAMQHEWLSEIGHQKKKYESGFAFPYSASPQFCDVILGGDVINGPVSTQIESIRAHFNEYGVISVAILPMFLDNGELTGFLSLQDCVVVRTFSKDEMDIMSLVGFMYINTFSRFKLQAEQYRIEVAEASNRAKSRFLARMSHEIRTPITAVLGISEIELQNHKLPLHTEESFAKIHHSATALLGLVNDILDLSKIEAGKMELLGEDYEVASVIVDTTHMHISHDNNRNVKFNLRVDENIPSHLHGDFSRIEQIMNNLLSNAFKYTMEGAVDLSISCRDDKREGYVTLVIAIKDSGIGMTPEQLNDLSNEYTRYHEQEYRFIEGTGLGMPIVYNLVSLMNAEIEIESKVGVGTNVIVSIPQRVTGSDVIGKDVAQNLENFKEMSAARKFAFTPEPMPYGSVLVVDDVEANLYVAKGLLDFYDLNVETCNSGYDAIEKIKQGKVYDLVFMDFMMPGLNGTETLRKMREMGYNHPIVALTANAMIGIAEEFFREGFDGFISKPIQTKQLNATLIKFIRDKYPADVVEAAKASKPKGDIDKFQRDPALLAKLRADFVRSHKNLFSDMCNAINAGDFETARRMAHTIKGSAGLIYEEALATAAFNIEQQLADKSIPAQSRLATLEQEFNRVLDDIGEVEETPIYSGERLEKDDALALLTQVGELLASRNSDCVGLIDELRKIPNSFELCREIEDFNFRDASQLLAELRDDLEAE